MKFSPVERRVLGCLIEKERSTPQNYPLTLNALRLACNQSTNRDPVVAYDDVMIEEALTSLRERKITRIVYSTSNRAAKFRHVLDEALRIGDGELAVLGVLLLRGPQTLGEIKGRAERLFAFADTASVQQTLDRLAAHSDGPLALRLDRLPGQKDARYIHLLGDDPGPATTTIPAALSTPAGADHPPSRSFADHGAEPAGRGAFDAPTIEQLAPDVASELQARLDRLEHRLSELGAEFDQFRSQFD
jgi:uncharacterized protein YceH (UPF0502 family)